MSDTGRSKKSHISLLAQVLNQIKSKTNNKFLPRITRPDLFNRETHKITQ